WPTAQPLRSVAKKTAVRSEFTGAVACCHVLPASFDTRMWPRWPTATRRLPARATPCSSDLLASGDACAATSSGSLNPAAAAALVASASARQAAIIDRSDFIAFFREFEKLPGAMHCTGEKLRGGGGAPRPGGWLAFGGRGPPARAGARL